MEMNRPLILVTNDDGVNAKGISALIEMVKPFGEVVVVAPFHGNSGMSHAITVKVPITDAVEMPPEDLEKKDLNRKLTRAAAILKKKRERLH